MKVLHFITTLRDGGAECVLFRLIQSLPTHQHCVISILPGGKYSLLLRELGIPVYFLFSSSPHAFFVALLNLRKIYKHFAPDIVQTWMYHADIIGGVASQLFSRCPVVWGIHNSETSRGKNSIRLYLTIRLASILSCLIPSKIISCSRVAIFNHIKIGYPAYKLVFVPNGIPLNKFYPDISARIKIRKEFQIQDDEFLIGMVARYHPQKDHLTLIRAFSMVQNEKVRLILVGEGLDSESPMRHALYNHNLAHRVILAGPRSDIPAIMNALDLHVLSSSSSEAFPNVLCEAMACGTPCIATDVGDSAFILNNKECVVPPSNPQELFNAIERMFLSRDIDAISEKCRKQATDRFSDEEMSGSYVDTWARLVQAACK
jgi:glycosyltransferase involved in cell wall biosynthesis